MTQHIARMLRLEPEVGTFTVHTHYVPAYAPSHPSDPARQAGVCGQYVPLQQHSLDPTCPACQTALQGDDDRCEEDEPLPRRWSEGR